MTVAVQTNEPKRRQFWDPAYAAVAITLVGGAIYTVFRFADISFYAPLHVAPEKVGLGYSQILVRGVIPAITIAAALYVVLAYGLWFFAFLIGTIRICVEVWCAKDERAILLKFLEDESAGMSKIRKELRESQRFRRLMIGILRSPELEETLEPSELQEGLRRGDSQAARQILVASDLREAIASVWEPLAERLPVLAGLFRRLTGDYLEQTILEFIRAEGRYSWRWISPLLKGSFRSGLSPWSAYAPGLLSRILRHRVTLGLVLLLTLAGFWMLIEYQGDRVAKGSPLSPAVSGLTGLRAEKATVGTVDGAKQLPKELTGQPALYLGDSNGIAVFYTYDKKTGTTMRLASSPLVVSIVR